MTKSSVCQITQEQSDSSSDDEYLYTFDQDPAMTKPPTVSVKVNSVPIEMVIDTGTSTDTLDENTFMKIN